MLTLWLRALEHLAKVMQVVIVILEVIGLAEAVEKVL
jgi:hypothetical protein